MSLPRGAGVGIVLLPSSLLTVWRPLWAVSLLHVCRDSPHVQRAALANTRGLEGPWPSPFTVQSPRDDRLTPVCGALTGLRVTEPDFILIISGKPGSSRPGSRTERVIGDASLETCEGPIFRQIARELLEGRTGKGHAHLMLVIVSMKE